MDVTRGGWEYNKISVGIRAALLHLIIESRSKIGIMKAMGPVPYE
jgi:ABC-type lipoprotein release transport system permease subunit